MPLTFVCRTSEVPTSTCREFFVGRRRVLICEHEGTYHAHSSICPHQGNSLDGASLWGRNIDCPWHHFLFDVVTGENVYPRSVYPTDRPDLLRTVAPLRTYATEVRDGDLFVSFDRV
jgi:3-phenylpropionate/trans-cinnamate dioxygenase ferredoxin component